MRARRIVFDALDIVLALLPDHAARRREIYRLHDWLLARGLTGVITSKAGGDDARLARDQPFGVMQFMVDCVVILNHSVVLGVSQRNLRVQKYRGSRFVENESPFLIGKHGLEVAVARTLRLATVARDQRARLERHRAARYHARRRVLPRRERPDHRLSRHGQDDVERRVRRGGVPRAASARCS